MSYTVREISTKYNLSTKAVYDAAKAQNITQVLESNPARFTKESVDKYWTRRTPSLNQEYSDLEKRIIVLENLIGL